MLDDNKKVIEAFERSIRLKQSIVDSAELPSTLVGMARRISSSLVNGGKLLLCGNGGSAADAQHLAAELLIRLKSQNDRMPLPALTLATDTSTITACGNDYSFHDIFARPLKALGKKEDVLLVISTSGNSENIYKALEAAHGIGIATLGFLGGNGGRALPLCDLAFTVPSCETAHIQEAHITAGHILMELVEDSVCSVKEELASFT